MMFDLSYTTKVLDNLKNITAFESIHRQVMYSIKLKQGIDAAERYEPHFFSFFSHFLSFFSIVHILWDFFHSSSGPEPALDSSQLQWPTLMTSRISILQTCTRSFARPQKPLQIMLNLCKLTRNPNQSDGCLSRSFLFGSFIFFFQCSL